MTDADDDTPGLHATEPAPDGNGRLMTGLPFGRELGMRLHEAGGGVSVCSVPYEARLVGDPETGVLHGGIVTALLDTACGWAVMAAPAPIRSTATLDLRIDYMRPARAGLELFARAECFRVTRSVAFCRAVAYQADPSDPVATAQGAFMLERNDDTVESSPEQPSPEEPSP